jgi:hypothetical protein
MFRTLDALRPPPLEVHVAVNPVIDGSVAPGK